MFIFNIEKFINHWIALSLGVFLLLMNRHIFVFSFSFLISASIIRHHQILTKERPERGSKKVEKEEAEREKNDINEYNDGVCW